MKKENDVNFKPMAFCVRGACKYLSIEKSTFYRLIESGYIKTVKIGRRTVVPRHQIFDLLEYGTDKLDKLCEIRSRLVTPPLDM